MITMPRYVYTDHLRIQQLYRSRTTEAKIKQSEVMTPGFSISHWLSYETTLWAILILTLYVSTELYESLSDCHRSLLPFLKQFPSFLVKTIHEGIWRKLRVLRALEVMTVERINDKICTLRNLHRERHRNRRHRNCHAVLLAASQDLASEKAQLVINFICDYCS